MRSHVSITFGMHIVIRLHILQPRRRMGSPESAQVSKVGLIWGGELKPTTEEAAPLLRDLSDGVLRLFALYNGIRLAAGAGATLAQHLTERATAILTASKVMRMFEVISEPGAERLTHSSDGQHVCLSMLIEGCCCPLSRQA